MLKHISLDALLELVDVIVIKILRELIVELGKLLDLYLVKSDLESGILACKLGSVLLGELDIDVEALACVVADDLILKAGDELTRTELELIVGALAALKSLAVDKALEVDDCDVALGGCAILNGDGSCVALSHSLDACINLFGGDGSFSLLGLETLVSLDLDILGLDGDFHLEENAVLADRLNIDVLRAVNRLDARFLVSVGNSLGESYLKCIFIEDILAVESLDHGKRSFALAETGKCDLVLGLVISLENSSLERLCADLDLQRIDVGVRFV